MDACGCAGTEETIMKITRNCFLISLLLFLVAGICWASPDAGDVTFADRDSTKMNTRPIIVDPAEWTFLFYLAADNEQEAYALATIDQLISATAQVDNHPQILVFLDRLSVTGTEVLKIAHGYVEMVEDYPTYAEQNSADSSVLELFTTYALNNPAINNNVAFVMKSEGLSWRGIGRDNTHDEEIDDQLMPIGDLADALIASQIATGRDIDLLVLEGSIMAFIEVVYDLRETAPILLATQSKIQPDGLPWEMVITDLGGKPDMSSRELGIAIADNHVEYYSDKGNNGVPNLDTSINFAAMTVFDLSHTLDVRDAHNKWAETTWSLLDEIYNILPHARDLSDVGGFGDITESDYQSDIRTFMTEAVRLIADSGLDFPEFTAAVEEYLTAQESLILYERNPEDGFKLGAANGLSIWYPPTWVQYQEDDASDDLFGSTMYYEDSAIGLEWVLDSSWTEYLFEYFDRAYANLAGSGIGSEGDEPPKPGVFD
jgi:hypothetical protein